MSPSTAVSIESMSVHAAAAPAAVAANSSLRGRGPYRFDVVARSRYLDYLRQGRSRTRSARSVGVSPRTVQRRMATDPEFRLLVLEAEGEADEAVEQSLYKRAIGGDVAAQKFWLQRRRPTEWGGREPTKTSSAPSEEEMRAEGYRLIRQVIDERHAPEEQTTG